MSALGDACRSNANWEREGYEEHEASYFSAAKKDSKAETQAGCEREADSRFLRNVCPPSKQLIKRIQQVLIEAAKLAARQAVNWPDLPKGDDLPHDSKQQTACLQFRL